VNRPRRPGRPAWRRVARWNGHAAGPLLGEARGSLITLAVLVGACVFAALAGPAQSLRAQTEALRATMAGLSSQVKVVTVTADWQNVTQLISPGAPYHLAGSDLSSATTALAHGFAAAGLPVGSGAWAGLTSPPYPVSSGAGPRTSTGIPPQVEVLDRPELVSRARLTTGAWTGSVPPRDLPCAVSTATAARFGLRPGSRLVLDAPTGPVTLFITGVVAARDPASTFWRTDTTAAEPIYNTPFNRVPYWGGAVFADPGQDEAMQAVFGDSGLAMNWEVPLAPGRLTASQARPVFNALNQVAGSFPQLGQLSGAAGAVQVSSPLTSSLGEFLDTEAAVDTVLVLLFVSLIVVGAAVISVAAWMVTVRRAAELTLLQARGASVAQLSAHLLRGAAAVALPAALLGAGLAFAIEGRGASSVLGWSLAALVIVVGLAGPVVIAAAQHRRPGPAASAARITASGEARPRRIAVRRWVAEATACAAAVAGLVVLHDQGLPAPGQTDLILAATPVLVAVPVALIVLRLYPLFVRALLAVAARAPGATGFVALAQASRNALTGVLPVFAVVLALSVAAFAGMVRSAVGHGEDAAAWAVTGADVLIQNSPASSPPGALDQVQAATVTQVAAVPGVAGTAVVWKTSWTAPGGTVTVLAVDPARYAALTATTPFPAFPAGQLGPAATPGAATTPVTAGTVIPVLASPAAAALLGRPGSAAQLTARQPDLEPIRVRVAGELRATPAQPGGGAWVIMPLRTLPGTAGSPAPEILLVTGTGISEPKLAAAVNGTLPNAAVTTRTAVLNSLTTAPLPRSAVLLMRLTVLAAAGLGLGTVMMGLALGAAQRRRTLARMTTMGLDHPTGLVVTEAMPAVLAAVVAGLACALALPQLVGPALTLAVFTGSGVPVAIQPGWVALGLPAAAVIVIAAAALAGQTWALRRRGVTSLLRAD
jgi:putative ABC transport system permease protein